MGLQNSRIERVKIPEDVALQYMQTFGTADYRRFIKLFKDQDPATIIRLIEEAIRVVYQGQTDQVNRA